MQGELLIYSTADKASKQLPAADKVHNCDGSVTGKLAIKSNGRNVRKMGEISALISTIKQKFGQTATDRIYELMEEWERFLKLDEYMEHERVIEQVAKAKAKAEEEKLKKQGAKTISDIIKKYFVEKKYKQCMEARWNKEFKVVIAQFMEFNARGHYVFRISDEIHPQSAEVAREISKSIKCTYKPMWRDGLSNRYKLTLLKDNFTSQVIKYNTYILMIQSITSIISVRQRGTLIHSLRKSKHPK
eukprot:g42925.t1